MRTTINLNDQLLASARARAAERGSTLKDVFEEALRRFLRPESPRGPYRLKWKVESGRLRPGVCLDDRDALFDLMDGR